ELPTVLGSYRILGELGRGGMGVVLKAVDDELQRVVALKVLSEGRTDRASRDRFVREGRAAAALKHDNIVAIHTVVSQADAAPFLVMEFVDGPSLARRIQAEKRLDHKEAPTICHQVACALAAAPRAGLVHRDIKPANILLDAP